MNVLHIHSGNLFGGVERMLETLAPAVAGRSPVNSAFALCFDGLVADALRSRNAEVFQLGDVRIRRLAQVSRARLEARRVLQRRWDVVCLHSSWSQAIFGPEVLRAGIPLVRWLHAPQPGPRWLEWWASKAPPALVLCNSAYTRSAAEGRLKGVDVRIQYPPLVASPPEDGSRKNVRSELGTRSDVNVIAVAARLEAWKGHRVLIESLDMLPRSGWELWVIGGAQRIEEHNYFCTLEKLCEQRGLADNVRFLGQRADVPRLLEGADIYCQPNEAPEPFGISFVEALSAGLPVVTTRLGAAAEIVDATCGFLVESGCPGAVANALRLLLESPEMRATMRVHARSRAAHFSDLERSISALANHLTHVISEHGAVAI